MRSRITYLASIWNVSTNITKVVYDWLLVLWIDEKVSVLNTCPQIIICFSLVVSSPIERFYLWIYCPLYFFWQHWTNTNGINITPNNLVSLVYRLYHLQLFVIWLVLHLHQVLNIKVLVIIVISTYGYYTVVRFSRHIKTYPSHLCVWQGCIFNVIKCFCRECGTCSRRELNHVLCIPNQVIIYDWLQCIWVSLQTLLYTLIDVVFISVPFVFVRIPNLSELCIKWGWCWANPKRMLRSLHLGCYYWEYRLKYLIVPVNQSIFV